MDGRPGKAVNQFSNKTIGALTGTLDTEREAISRQVNGGKKRTDPGYVHVWRKPSARLDRLWARRNSKIGHYLHSAAAQLAAELARVGVHTVVIGWNKSFKDSIKLGRRSNQNFVQIPHRTFVDILTYLLTECGITVISTEEAYRSKASFLDGDVAPTYDETDQERLVFSGKRVSRGLYRSRHGSVINADLNGAYNIMRKVFNVTCPVIPDGRGRGGEVVPVRRLSITGYRAAQRTRHQPDGTKPPVSGK